MSNLSRTADRVGEAADLMWRAIELMFFTVLLTAMVCTVVLIAAFTFGVLHNGDDFDFGGSRGGGGGDVIVLPTRLL